MGVSDIKTFLYVKNKGQLNIEKLFKEWKNASR